MSNNVDGLQCKSCEQPAVELERLGEETAAATICVAIEVEKLREESCISVSVR